MLTNILPLADLVFLTTVARSAAIDRCYGLQASSWTRTSTSEQSQPGTTEAAGGSLFGRRASAVLSMQRAVFSDVPACLSMVMVYSYGLTSLLSRSALPLRG